MARPVKPGLNYFPFDVDTFDDDKLLLISDEFGIKGEYIYIRLLAKIYKTNGYYYPWGEDEARLFAKSVGNGITGTCVNEIVQGCLRRSLLDERVFKSFKILTSKGIQDRYAQVCKQLSRPVRIELGHDCRSLAQLKQEAEIFIQNKGWADKTQLPPSKLGFSGGETTHLTAGNSQTKVKETKQNENELKLFDTNAGYLKRFFTEPELHNRNLLAEHIRLPPPATIQQPWIRAFNVHLEMPPGKEHPSYEQWFSHLRYWLPQNLNKLKTNQPASQSTAKQFKTAPR